MQPSAQEQILVKLANAFKGHDALGAYKGAVCNTRQGFVNGVWVEGYWSRRMNACVNRVLVGAR